MPEAKSGPDKFGIEHATNKSPEQPPYEVKTTVKEFQETRVRDKNLNHR